MSYQTEEQIRHNTNEIRKIRYSIQIPVAEEPQEDYRFIQVGNNQLKCVTDPGLIWAWDEHMAGKYE